MVAMANKNHTCSTQRYEELKRITKFLLTLTFKGLNSGVQRLYMKEFLMKRDGFCRFITILFCITVLGMVVFLVWRSSGTYLPAWFAILASSIILLILLSVPRRVVISQHNVELHSLLDVKTIPLCEITHVGFVPRRVLKASLPLLGSFGVFGYFGYFYCIKRKQVFKFFARSRKNLVEIHYHGQKRCVVVGVRNAREFVRILQNKIDN